VAYEIYVREFATRSSSTPKINISDLGRCMLNRAAAEIFHKEAVEQILLLWDAQSRKFAMRPITKKDARSFTLRYSFNKQKVVQSAAFGGVMFFRHIGYDFKDGGTYPVIWNANDTIFEVELPESKFQGAQQPLIAVEGGRKAHGRAV
jgi:hypothetical protein